MLGFDEGLSVVALRVRAETQRAVLMIQLQSEPLVPFVITTTLIAGSLMTTRLKLSRFGPMLTFALGSFIVFKTTVDAASKTADPIVLAKTVEG